MRPLARALTKNLDSLRSILRDQCLRSCTEYSDRVSINTWKSFSGRMLSIKVILVVFIINVNCLNAEQSRFYQKTWLTFCL